MIIYSRPGKALVLALLCVAIADCGNNPAANPKRVEASALQAEIRDPQARFQRENRGESDLRQPANVITGKVTSG